ncbi:Late competence development protein ComFB [Pseudoalteromonas sp. P1-9]|uniref:late competence development ComFB family protein n=1 Tax=Pseudoalteromonas sp. P1-9 TaxID=1710354 RepID=UPI0006D611B4|nr:late competence development ComFB family protein [Pseudoalteromonas sp. P1-9]KPV95564.1 Late competence development protein ComFB [Pseudoalteromonas sp. P1-9]
MKLHDDIHNYYEKLLTDEIEKQKIEAKYDKDTLADFCCTALNQLPARYIRFEVDMAFYSSQSERLEMEQRVRDAIEFATAAVAKRGNSDD